MESQLIEGPKTDEVRQYKLLIGGKWVDARSGRTFESVNPYTGRVWALALRAGTVWINSYPAVSFTAPFGGYNESGLGRENGLESLKEYTQPRTVWVELSGEVRDPFKLG